MENDWWGEPLAAMLSRVLVSELSQRLPQSVVLSESGAVSSPPDATIALNVQRLDEDAAGNLILQAQAGVSFKGRGAPALRSFRFACRHRRQACRPRSPRSAPRSASSPMGWRPCCSRDRRAADAPARTHQPRDAGVSRMPGLRTVSDHSRACAGHDRDMRTLLDRPASRHRPPDGSQYRADVAALVLLHRDVHDHADERADGRHRAQRRPAFGPGRACAARHAGARGRRGVRHRDCAVRQADRHALRADPAA